MRMMIVLGAMGVLVSCLVACRSKTEQVVEMKVAHEAASAGRVVMDKLSAVVLPQVNFQDITVEEAIAFLSNRLMEIELEDEPELRGISMIVSLPPEQTAGASEAAPAAPQPTINLVQKDIKWLDAFAEVLRQGHVDGYLTSVGFVITAEGQAPFPNSKAEHGEIWHVLRKTR